MVQYRRNLKVTTTILALSPFPRTTTSFLVPMIISECSFEKAVMKDVQFGVYPDFVYGSTVLCVAMSKKGNLLACGMENGEVQIWDYLVCVK